MWPQHPDFSRQSPAPTTPSQPMPAQYRSWAPGMGRQMVQPSPQHSTAQTSSVAPTVDDRGGYPSVPHPRSYGGTPSMSLGFNPTMAHPQAQFGAPPPQMGGMHGFHAVQSSYSGNFPVDGRASFVGSSMASQTRGRCVGCGANPVVHCPNCQVDYCAGCNANIGIAGPAHVNLHRPVPVGEVGPSVVLSQSLAPSAASASGVACKQHNKHLSLFCNDCTTPVCSQCVVFGTHKDHECITLDLAYNMCVDAVDTKLRSLQKTMDSRRLYVEQLEAAKQQLGANVHHALALLQQDMGELVAKMDQKELALLEEVQAIHMRSKEKLQAKAEGIQGELEEVVKLHKAVQYICDEGSAVQFLQSLTAMSRDLATAIENDKKRDKDVGVQSSLHLQVFTDDVIDGISRLRVDSSLFGVDLKYGYDLDEHGLFYRLGTMDGPSFVSPVDLGLVHVSASSWHLNSEANAPSAVYRQNPGYILTTNRPGSFVRFQLLKGFTVSPTHYRIQNGGPVKEGTELNYVLRNWNFEGSVNGTEWDVLRSHRHDGSLAVKEHATASWTIDAKGVQYTTFRIVGTGADSGGQNFVHFGSIEIWGKMMKPDESFLQ